MSRLTWFAPPVLPPASGASPPCPSASAAATPWAMASLTDHSLTWPAGASAARDGSATRETNSREGREGELEGKWRGRRAMQG